MGFENGQWIDEGRGYLFEILSVCYILFLASHHYDSYTESLDFAADLQRQRTDTLQTEFHDEQSMLMKEFDTERAFLIEQHASEISDLQDIMFAMEQNFSERENEARSDFQSQRDEIKNKVGYHGINSVIRKIYHHISVSV